MNQLDKLIKHIALVEKGITPADKIKPRIHKETKPYGQTRTVFAIDVFELEDHRHGMCVSATKTTPSGRPSGVTQRFYSSAPEFDPVNGSLLLPKSLDGTHTSACFGGEGEPSEITQEGLSSIVNLLSMLQKIDVVVMLLFLVVPFQGLQKWSDPDMLDALQEEWNRLRQDISGELMWMLANGAL